MAQQIELHSAQESKHITLFADVILPLPLPALFTYRVPQAMNDALQIGARVIVQFGTKKVLTAVVARIHEEAPQKYQAKYLLELLDETPMVTPQQIQLFEWMAQYYMCHVGEVLNVALPSALKISSQSRIQLNPNAPIPASPTTEKEQLLIEALQRVDTLTYDEAAEMAGVKNIYQLIKSLAKKELILIFEEIKERYTPKIIKKIRLAEAYLSKPALEKLLSNLEKTPKQLDIVLAYLQKSSFFQNISNNSQGVEKKIFTQNTNLSKSSLKTLIDNHILEEIDLIVSRFPATDALSASPPPELSTLQKEAYHAILASFEKHSISLLHGITGSGKTEIFIALIKQALQSGTQVLYLLPEIALTTQIVTRLKKYFGNAMGIYHSKFSDNERAEVWQGIISGRYAFVVGVRSAIFLPFQNLGLIIVDEEHETSYKQADPAPRYHARDVAAWLSQQQHCKVLLGSATPSLESFFLAKNEKYGLIQLKERFGNAQLPQIHLADIKQERRLKINRQHFTSQLLTQIDSALQNKEQIILFQNRRGYAPYTTCRICSWVPKCENCAVSLTYHRFSNELRCHYCGYQMMPPTRCEACHSNQIETVGLGTEKIEEELKILLPDISVQRMDLDTTRKKDSYQKIIQDFEQARIDVLVGTQMLSKGLDFDRVSVVGIFDIDRMLHFPDFRAVERAFQIITQVSGRAGRKNKQGNVIIQTQDTTHPIFEKIIQNDYEGMYAQEIVERQKYLYPPFSRLIKLILKHPDKIEVKKAADDFAKKLTKTLSSQRVLGPEAPVIDRIRNQYLQHILIKIERQNTQLLTIKQHIRKQISAMTEQTAYKKLSIVVEVDPI
ncbi:MAG: primosomal protein N' [Cytophagales bacterium]|nr:MAG: primosomal protein N' [Cytophagales bacterium]